MKELLGKFETDKDMIYSLINDSLYADEQINNLVGADVNENH